jgi:5'-methylthioadenosine phosphorylase
VHHVDFTEPYDADLSRRILAAGQGWASRSRSMPFALPRAAPGNGGRGQSPGARWADVVGMTGMPEAVLARELELPYAAINVIANHAAGRGDSVNGIHFESLEHVLHDAMGPCGASSNAWSAARTTAHRWACRSEYCVNRFCRA